MPIAGGVLNLVAGVLGVISCLALFILAIVLQGIRIENPPLIDDPDVLPIFVATFLICGIVFLIMSIISIVGGVFACRRKRWGWALAGSICSVLIGCSTIIVSILGIIAVVFIAMSKKAFTSQGQD